MGSRNITISGKACQPWAENSPHAIPENITDNMFPDGSKEAAKNFCRNPDIQYNDGVWCYTMDDKVEWEFCDICPGNYEGYNACVLPDNGAGYTGVLAHSKSFQECEPWTSHLDPSFEFPDESAEDAKNHCRNPTPNGREGPWCFIVADVNGTAWDYCDVCKPFEGSVALTPGSTNSLSNITNDDMGRLACLHWCISMTYCLAAAVGKVKRSCNYMVALGGSSEPRTDVDIYTVTRSCREDSAATA